MHCNFEGFESILNVITNPDQVDYNQFWVNWGLFKSILSQCYIYFKAIFTNLLYLAHFQFIYLILWSRIPFILLCIFNWFCKFYVHFFRSKGNSFLNHERDLVILRFPKAPVAWVAPVRNVRRSLLQAAIWADNFGSINSVLFQCSKDLDVEF